MIKFNMMLTLVDEMLGTKPDNDNVFADYVASKHPSGTPQRDELDNAEHIESAGTTVFHRDASGKPAIYDYQMKGFCKDACGALRRADGTLSKELKAYKSVIDGCVFFSPRIITLQLPLGAQPGICERPLRIDGPMGPRVALARSETVPAGTILETEVTLLAANLKPVLLEWFKYGEFRGPGQWRNSGKGRFTFVVKEQPATA